MTHTILASTAETLRKRHFVSLRAAAVGLGFDPSFAPTIGRVLSEPPGPVSLENENGIREALNLAPRARRRYLRPCLSLDPAVRLGQLLDLADECRYELDEKRGVPHE
jgi:hypothetical protein